MRKETIRHCQRIKKAMDHKANDDNNCKFCPWKVPKGLIRGKKEMEIG